MTARELLEFTLHFYFKGPANQINQRIDEMLELVGLEEKANRPIKGFSGGEKQRLGIALAQVNYPDLLILDEPAAALDPIGRMQVLQVMERLQKHTTIFYSTHILDDVQRVSDAVAILNQGKLLVQGPIQEILNGQNGIVYTSTVKTTDSAKLKQHLSSFPWISHLAIQPTNGAARLSITVSDAEAGEKHLLREILRDETTIVLEFNRKQYELEEVFMEMVKGEEK
jgi:ABC-2 type transport system ATP-binding protein